MTIEVRPAEDEDMLALFTIASRSFARNEPFWDAMFPEHWTEAGRKVGGKRFLDLKKADPHVHYLKAVKTETGKIAGFARWLVWSEHIPRLPPKGDNEYWSTTEDADYFYVAMVEFLTNRFNYVEKAGGKCVSLDICVVDPDYQRQGVGHKLVEWGTKTADDMKCDAIVESSVPGRGLYEQHGFIFQRNIELVVPEQYADRAKNRFAWLIRPKKS